MCVRIPQEVLRQQPQRQESRNKEQSVNKGMKEVPKANTLGSELPEKCMEKELEKVKPDNSIDLESQISRTGMSMRRWLPLVVVCMILAVRAGLRLSERSESIA